MFFVLHCHTELLGKKKYAADLGITYSNSVKMPFKVHAKNEAFCCNKSSSKWGVSEGVHLAELWQHARNLKTHQDPSQTPILFHLAKWF